MGCRRCLAGGSRCRCFPRPPLSSGTRPRDSEVPSWRMLVYTLLRFSFNVGKWGGREREREERERGGRKRETERGQERGGKSERERGGGEDGREKRKREEERREIQFKFTTIQVKET